MKPAPPPPPSFTRPHATAAEVLAALKYADWLGQELSSTATHANSGPDILGAILRAAIAVALRDINNHTTELGELYTLLAEWIRTLPVAGTHGMTIGQARAERN